jgi:parvulin-like peptidyl-prolyl isomerase
MHRLIVPLLILSHVLSSTVYGQSTLQQSLQQVASVAEAEQFVREHPPLQASLRVLRPSSDTAAIDRQLYHLAVGEVRSIGQQTYKIIDDTTTYAFRASYIYLDGSQLSTATIDSLRRLILRRYAAGTAFEQLADTYNMDGNKNHGDLGIFPAGRMVAPFEQAVRSHTCGEVFTVDVPGNQWYYVVKKTAPDQVTRVLTVLQVNSQ